MTTERPGKRLGQQGREEIAALTDDELYALAGEHGVAIEADDGTGVMVPVDRQEIVNEVANKVRQADRQANKGTES